MKIFSIIATCALITLSLNCLAKEEEKKDYCNINEEARTAVLQQIKSGNKEAISSIPKCYSLDRGLILRASIIDISQLNFADKILKNDANFMMRLIKINPEALKYASDDLRSDENFMEDATYISRDSLKYATTQLLDSKLFMRRMIKIDPRNYIFASDRLKENVEFAQIAFEDDGMLLLYAPESVKANKSLVKIAFKSNNLAIKYAADNLKTDPEFKIVQTPALKISENELDNFINKNYVVKKDKKSSSSIYNKAKFFSKNKIIDRNYITKWQQNPNSNYTVDYPSLVNAASRNYQVSWKKDLAKYPDLIEKIEKFFLNHKIDQNTINDLSLTYLWKVKNKPLTLAFNLYLLRENSDSDLESNFCDITSLTAIVQKVEGKWEMTVVEVIFDSETQVKLDYPNGHKKYILWDLYRISKKDPSLKLIFKIEDKFEEYFEVFYEENHGKYEMTYRIKIDDL